MTTINRLSSVGSLTAGDNFPLYSPQQGDARRVSLTVLTDYLAANMDAVQVQSVLAALWLGTPAVAVASLPTGVTAGTRAAVSNATQTLTAGIGAVVAGGGANTVPVFYDGTNWRIG